jgi:hypothetical protein
MHSVHGIQLKPTLVPEQQLELEGSRVVDTSIPTWRVLQDDAGVDASPGATRTLS